MMTTRLAPRVVGTLAALLLAFSGVSAYASVAHAPTSDTTAQFSLRDDAPTKAKKCKKKNKKKCKKPATGEFVPGRVLEIEYTGSAIGSMDSPATIYPFGPLFPVNFVPGAGETQAMIEIVDAAGPNASAGFSYDSDGDGLNDSGFDVCGTTEEPVEVLEGMQYNIFPYLLPSTSCTDAVATTGTITVTFNAVD